MPQFVYQARDNQSLPIHGRLEAESEHAALTTLTRQGYFPVSIREDLATASRAARPLWAGRRRVPVRVLGIFTRQLADLIGAGLPLLSALNLLSQQTTHPLLRATLVELIDHVRGGASLSDAMEQHLAVFASLYVNMVRAGELGGALEGVLNRLADFAEAQDELRVKVQMALVYPVIIVTFGILVVVGLLTFVVPKLIALYEELGQQLPLPTRMLLAISHAVLAYGWALAVAAVGGVFWVQRLRRTSYGRLWAAQHLHQLPIVGALLQQVEIARMARSLGMLIGNGAPLLESLEVVTRSSGSAMLQRELEAVHQAVAGGSSLAQAMRQGTYILPDVTSMIAVGEESGSLETALAKVAVANEKQADRTTRLFTTLLEPALILAVGVVVGFIVMAMLLPIFQVSLLAG